MKIFFSDKARSDLIEIKFYLKNNFPKHLKNTIQTIKYHCVNLSKNNFLGVETELKGVRVYVTPKLPYSIYYTFDEKTLYILRVYHEARSPDEINY
jgi:plasmid stabilization system protein ParE